MRAAICGLAALLSALAYSPLGSFFIAGGSDVLTEVARPSAVAVGLAVIGVCLAAVIVARRPRDRLARASFVVALLVWALLGRGVNLRLVGGGDVRGHWYLFETGRVVLAPGVDTELVLRDGSFCVDGWRLVMSYAGRSESLWLGPFAGEPARELLQRRQVGIASKGPIC